MNKKDCTKCLTVKSLSSFSKKKGGRLGLNSACKKCVSDYKKIPRVRKLANEASRKRPRTNETREKERVWKNKYKKTKSGSEAILSYNIKRYGITVDDYNEMFKNQSGACLICEKHQTDLTRRLAVDHCHDTGKVRGLLCSPCNAALGGFGDNVQMLKRAIKYLTSTSNKE